MSVAKLRLRRFLLIWSIVCFISIRYLLCRLLIVILEIVFIIWKTEVLLWSSGCCLVCYVFRMAFIYRMICVDLLIFWVMFLNLYILIHGIVLKQLIDISVVRCVLRDVVGALIGKVVRVHRWYKLNDE